MQEKESTQQKCENQMNELCATLEKYKVNSLTSLKYIFTLGKLSSFNWKRRALSAFFKIQTLNNVNHFTNRQLKTI